MIYLHALAELEMRTRMALVPGSRCDRLLVSLPYPWGPNLQTCHVGDRHVDFLWLLPITQEECDFKVTNGLEALESLL